MDHRRMHAMYRGHFRHSALALHGLQRNASLEARVMAPALLHVLWPPGAWRSADISSQLPSLPDFRGGAHSAEQRPAPASLPAPCARFREAVHSVVRPVVAASAKLLEQQHRRAPLAPGQLLLRLQDRRQAARSHITSRDVNGKHIGRSNSEIQKSATFAGLNMNEIALSRRPLE